MKRPKVDRGRRALSLAARARALFLSLVLALSFSLPFLAFFLGEIDQRPRETD